MADRLSGNQKNRGKSMELTSIASSSEGMRFLWEVTTKLLVDCGISAKRVESGLKELDLSPEDLDVILITP
jgi:metal-dependent hydrolase (beta-lactamase superfamily II)